MRCICKRYTRCITEFFWNCTQAKPADTGQALVGMERLQLRYDYILYGPSGRIFLRMPHGNTYALVSAISAPFHDSFEMLRGRIFFPERLFCFRRCTRNNELKFLCIVRCIPVLKTVSIPITQCFLLSAFFFFKLTRNYSGSQCLQQSTLYSRNNREVSFKTEGEARR